MIQQTPESDRFKDQMRESLISATKHSQAINVAKHNNVSTVGDERERAYFIETGQIKLVMLSSEGKECMLAIHGCGDVFGEMCLSGLGRRLETATAMEDTSLKEIPCGKFLERLVKDSLLEGFVKYLAVRVADQQQVIANLVTVDSETRLGETLLRISHEELATMVGTTRPRISVFMQRFRNLGLIESSLEHYMIIKERKLTAY